MRIKLDNAKGRCKGVWRQQRQRERALMEAAALQHKATEVGGTEKTDTTVDDHMSNKTDTSRTAAI
jgi:hypothetical protein